LNKYYDLYNFVYPSNKTIQNLCLLALKRFQKALDDNILPNISKDNLVKLLREKKLLAQISSEKYGTFKADKALNAMLNERQIAKTEENKCRKDKEALNVELIKFIKKNSYGGIKGSEWMTSFNKKGSFLVVKAR